MHLHISRHALQHTLSADGGSAHRVVAFDVAQPSSGLVDILVSCVHCFMLAVALLEVTAGLVGDSDRPHT